MSLTLEFARRPSAIAYQLRALVPSRGLDGGFPSIRARWRGHRLRAAYVAELLELTDLDALFVPDEQPQLRSDPGRDVFFPHVFGFPLQMAIITHPAFPLAIWKALQIRQSFIRHRPLPLDEALSLETSVAGQRVLDKGAEVDLYTAVCARDELIWEGLNTFYYRGRFGAPGAAATLAKAPEVGSAALSTWHMASSGGRRFAALTGDYNGIHLWRWYARLLGFRGAFLHPQRVLGQCLARLPAREGGAAQRLDVWLKGPVYYGSRVELAVDPEAGGLVFALRADRDARPALIGRLSSSDGPDRGLLDPLDRLSRP